MPTAEAALTRLCLPEAEVSAHYLIAEDGRTWHLVDEAARAWHAGQGSWGGRGDVNSRSIGIELANAGGHPFPEPQMAALERLLPGILERWSIPAQGVIAHSDMAPERKNDPGPRFDWARLALQDLSVWPQAAEPGDFWADAGAFGYDLPESCETPQEAVLQAFRLRFRPWARGPVTVADRAVMAALAARFPVDREGSAA